MACARLRPSFLAAVCGCLVGGVSLACAEPMGDLGGADRLVVRGPSAETAASLRQGLLDDGDLYWLGIPTADREPYLAALRTRVPLALEAAGFPEPRATVTVGPGPDGKESVLIDVVAGKRLTAGAIRVTGIPDDMAARLVKHIQQPQPPADAVPETITLPDGSEKVLWFDANGEPAKLGQPAWTPGEPAPCGERCASELLGAVAGFFSCDGYLSLVGWKGPWDEGYHEAIREHVDVEVRAEGDDAVLAIDVKRLPARTTLAGIEVNDGLRTTPADLLAYLGLDIGQPVTAADRQAWLGKLRLSGRFIKQACRFEPRGDRCVGRLELVEYKRAAPLDRGVSPEQQALLRARAWLFTDTSRFEGSFLADWAPGATLKLFVDPQDQTPGLSVGWVMVTGGSARCAFQIEPVTCNAEGWTSRRVGGDLVIETTDADGHQELWLDSASGRPRKLIVVADSGRMEILCDSGTGLVAAVAAARAAVLMVCTADQAAAARELARMPAASLWTPELEALCAALGPQGRNLDRRAREALARRPRATIAWETGRHPPLTASLTSQPQ